MKNSKRYPEEYENAKFLTAISFINDGQYSEGINILKKIDEKGLCSLNNKAFLYSTLGAACGNNGDFSDAIMYYKKSEELHSQAYGSDLDYYWDIELPLALAYICNNQRDLAAEKVNYIIEFGKNNLSEDDYIGLLVYLQNKYADGGQWADKNSLLIAQELSSYYKSQDNWAISTLHILISLMLYPVIIHLLT